MPITLSLVGRTNVGKSTIFNYLTRTKAALTADIAGVTRDRREGSFVQEGQQCHIIDTGGFDIVENTLTPAIQQQVHYAIQQSDYIGFVVDARSGLLHQDQAIASILRSSNKPVICLVNKVEGHLSEASAMAEFAVLGFKQLYPVSALQGKGLMPIMNTLLAQTPLEIASKQSGESVDELEEPIKIAMIGRPNAGKSTLVNRLLGEERQIVSPEAGTTRDSIDIQFHQQGHAYILVDTAGIRRLANITSQLEKATVYQSLSSLKASTVVLLLIDAVEGLTDQDLRLLETITHSGRALVILGNKWDQLDIEEKLLFQKELKRRLRFIPFVKTSFISALYGTSIAQVLPLVREAYQHATHKLSTSQLTQLLQKAIGVHHPPRTHHRTVKLRYAHPGGYNPPMIIIHGTHVGDISSSYKRYLHNFYQKQLALVGTPLKLEFREKRSEK